MPAVSLPTPVVEPDLCVTARLPSSLAPRQRWVVFATLAMVSLTTATGFMLAGAWPVLPYSIVELAALGAAFVYVQRRIRNWERLTVAGDRLIVERVRGRSYERREWNRPWVQVLDTGESPRGRGMLELRCAGESWNFGEALLAHQRQALAKDLRRMIALQPAHSGTDATGSRQQG